mgnify:CR=1 FL=1
MTTEGDVGITQNNTTFTVKPIRKGEESKGVNPLIYKEQQLPKSPESNYNFWCPKTDKKLTVPIKQFRWIHIDLIDLWRQYYDEQFKDIKSIFQPTNQLCCR